MRTAYGRAQRDRLIRAALDHRHDAEGFHIEFLGPAFLRLDAARAVVPARDRRRLFIGLFEGAKMTPFELALIADTHRRDPSFRDRAWALWLDETERPGGDDVLRARADSAHRRTSERQIDARAEAIATRRRTRAWSVGARRSLTTAAAISRRRSAPTRTRGTRGRSHRSRRRVAGARRGSGSADPGGGSDGPPGTVNPKVLPAVLAIEVAS